jgi:CheY-like chemotaxis protein
MSVSDQAKPLILLAEDSDDDAFFFQRAFSRAALTCGLLRAENGKIAVDLLGKSRSAGTPPFLIFLDLKMPVMSGFDVLHWLKDSGFTPAPQVIVLSGSNDHEDRSRAFSLGATDYLVKPISSEVLRQRVMGALKQAEPSMVEAGVSL